MKRFFALVLAMMLVASLVVPAMAEETKLGSIKINGVSEDNHYEIYKMLDLRYGESANAFTYILPDNSLWTEFFSGRNEEFDGSAYIKIDPTSKVAEWITAEDATTKAAFAKLALAYAEKKGITPDKSSKDGDMAISGEDTKVGLFKDLALGYYLVDSTMGALCGLTTTAYNAEINAKNGVPTMTKWVYDVNSKQWVASTTAAMGDIIRYQVIIDAHNGAQDYILHDAMEDGLSFVAIEKVEHIIPGEEPHEVDKQYYHLKKSDDADFKAHSYKVDNATSHVCDFEIHFDDYVCDRLLANHRLIIYYQVRMNEKANIHNKVNVNTAWLSFGDPKENHTTTPSSVQTSTFFADILKTDSFGALIPAGAWFRIYNAAEQGVEIPVVPYEYETGEGEPLVGKSDELKDMEGKNITEITSYRLAVTDDEKEFAAEIYAYNGQIRIYGLDAATYYLEETKEPAGYNPLTTRKSFTIVNSNLEANKNTEGEVTGIGYAVQVINKTGSNLPETGAMGTTMFITFGMFVMLATGILLVTKKRMSMIED